MNFIWFQARHVVGIWWGASALAIGCGALFILAQHGGNAQAKWVFGGLACLGLMRLCWQANSVNNGSGDGNSLGYCGSDSGGCGGGD